MTQTANKLNQQERAKQFHQLHHSETFWFQIFGIRWEPFFESLISGEQPAFLLLYQRTMTEKEYHSKIYVHFKK
jgi:hypothetical protein